MGELARASRRVDRKTPALNRLFSQGFVPTQLGDPNFSRAATPNTQLQFPAAAAEGRVYDTKTRATNQLQMAQAAGLDISGPDYDELREASEKGFISRALTLGEQMLGWLGAPFETVNLFIQDVVGGEDTTASFLDYANALWGGVEDDEEFFEKTGMSPHSFSETLTMFGWDPNDEEGFQPERILRGIVDFGGSVLIDPLSWPTWGFAGLGRKAGMMVARKLQLGTASGVRALMAGGKNLDDFGNVAKHIVDDSGLPDYTKHLARTHKQTMDEFAEEVGTFADFQAGNIDDSTLKDMISFFKGEHPLSAGKDIFDNYNSLAVAARIGREVIRPTARKDFGAVNALALKELPLWASGGMRIGVPAFNRKTANMALLVPGTVGLGRKLTPAPLKELGKSLRSYSKKYDALANHISSARDASDMFRPAMRGLRDGSLEPWRFHLIVAEMASVNSQYHRQNVTVALNHLRKKLSVVGSATDVDDEGSIRLLTHALEETKGERGLRRETEALADATSGSNVITTQDVARRDLDDVVEESREYMRGIYDDVHAEMSELDPSFSEKYIDGYINYSFTPDGDHLIKRFLKEAANIPEKEWAAAAEHGEPGKSILVRILNARGRTGRLETNLGANLHKDRPWRLQAQTLADGGNVVMLRDDYMVDTLAKNMSPQMIGPELTTRYPSIDQTNEWLEAAVRANAEEFGIAVPKNWDGKMMVDDPFDLLIEYVGVMDDTIKMWRTVKALRMAGLIVPHPTAFNVQDMLQSLMSNIHRQGKKIPIGAGAASEGSPASILPGKQDLVDGIPENVIPAMKKAGLDPTDFGGTRQLYQVLEDMTRGAFRQLQVPFKDGLPEAVGAGAKALSIEVVDDIPVIKYVAAPNLNREAAILQIDEAFRTGVLKGRLNHENMVALAKAAPDDATSDLLYDFYTRKMVSIGDEAREFLGKNPGEFVEIGVVANDFNNGVNELLADYTAKIDPATGKLIEGGRETQQIATRTSPFAYDFNKLRTAARDLSDRGYDEAIDIMRDVEDLTGISDLPNYLSPSDFGLGGPAVEGMFIQRNIGLWLKNVARNTATVYTPEGVAAAKMATNKILSAWRPLATLARPAFHIRNAVSAAWMNMVVGVRGETYLRLTNNTLKWRKALREGLSDPYSVIDPDLRVAWKAANEQDVMAGFVTSEARGRMAPADKQSRLDWLNVTNPDKFVATRIGGRAMENIEDYARMAVFLEYFEEGVEGSAELAREVVHAVHFDYNNLTPLETKIKSWVPFFVWTRRNLPRQLEMMVERPGIVQRYKHLMQSMNDNFGGEDDRGMPIGDMFTAYAAGTNFYVNPDTPFWARIMIDPDIPTAELLNIPSLDPGQIGDFVNSLLGPHVTSLININEQRDWDDVNAPAPLNTILKGLAMIGFFDETIGGDVRIPYWVRTLGETALPFSRDLIDPLTGGPTDTNRQQRMGIAEDDNFLESSLKTVLGTLGKTIGLKANTPVDIRATAFRSQEELDKVIRDLRERGLLLPSQG